VICAAFVPLLSALERSAAGAHPVRRGFSLGYATGFTFYLIGTHWIARLSDVAITVPWLKYPAWLAAAAYLALYPAVACALACGLSRRSGRSLAAIFPVTWLLIEELRASGELGFPWFQPGYALHAFVPLIQMASLGSVSLVTAWVLLVNVLLWRALEPLGTAQVGRASPSPRVLAVAALALALLLPALWGRRVLATEPAAGPPRPRIALVQGNVAGEIKWAGHHQREILDTFLALSAQAMSGPDPPRLLIWPETATGSYLRRQVDQAIEVARFASEHRVPVFSGYPDYQVDSAGVVRYVNGAGMFYPDGAQSQVYAKRHLVPFGERMPFQWLIPQLGHLELGQAEWTPGLRAVLFPGPGGYFSCLVCFEAIFPDLARADVRGGARWLVNITNDEWFGNSVAIDQHAGMAVFRAVENHVPLARCANTGLTMMVDAFGRVTRRLPVLAAGTLVAPLPAAGPATPYTRVGDWPGMLALVLAAFHALRPTGKAAGAR
jgi:apolipoprotein N-acyltransferase